MSSSAVPYKNQHYADLKKLCIQTKTLFEDPEFPADNSSLFYSKPPPGAVHWKRPGEICKAPHLFVEGISSHDLNQGVVGNCWFVAACSCLALKPHLWKRVIPNWKEQEWDSNHPGNYAGIFHFQFWIFGEWIDVVVDDRLPTINGKLIYCHSKQKNEFWSALLEKAYAKLAGCYQSLDGGNTGDAVVDFSGAVSEAIDLKNEKFYKDQNKQKTFFAELLKVWGRGGIISCSIRAGQHEIELQMDNGLVKGHAYSVTAVKEVRLEPRHGYIGKEAIPLVRMRNPWGKTEWKGAWSDSSEEWSKVNDTERKQLGITVEDDGEFWMSFKDWCRLFTDADVCRLINTSMHFGSWTVNENPLLNRCGGCVNHKQTFLQNPQYLFDVTEESDEVLISLQQQDRKIHRKKGQGENPTIGFSILRVELNRKYRLHDILTQECLHTSTYINARTVFMRCMLPQGRYVIIPTTFTPSIQGDYMLRLFTDVDSGCRELVKDKPDLNCWSPIFGYPQAVSHIYVKGAEIHQHSDQVDGIELYVTISCEGQSVSSTIKKNTLNPDFEISAVFYRKKLSKPIKVQVWNTNLEDNFLGQVVLPGLPTDISDPQQLQLKKNGLNMAGNMVGNISLRIVTASQLTAI